MGGIVGGVFSAELDVDAGKIAEEPPELRGLQAFVHPDGGGTDFMLHMSDGDLKISASFDQVSAAHREIAGAANLMKYRQCMKKDKGNGVFDGLLQSALRPIESTCVIDPETGSYYYVMQFADRLPIAVMLTVEQVLVLRSDTSAKAKRAAN